MFQNTTDPNTVVKDAKNLDGTVHIFHEDKIQYSNEDVEVSFELSRQVFHVSGCSDFNQEQVPTAKY